MAQAWSYIGATQVVQLHLDLQNIEVDLVISLVAINCTWVFVIAIRNLFGQPHIVSYNVRTPCTFHVSKFFVVNHEKH